MLQCVAVCCSVLQCVASEGAALILGSAVLQCALQCIAVYCRLLQSVAECCFGGQGLKSEFRSGCRLAKRVLEDISKKSALYQLFYTKL